MDPDLRVSASFWWTRSGSARKCKPGAVKNNSCTVKVQSHHCDEDPDQHKMSHSDPHLVEKSDPDPHQSEKSDPDLHGSEKPDPQNRLDRDVPTTVSANLNFLT